MFETKFFPCKLQVFVLLSFHTATTRSPKSSPIVTQPPCDGNDSRACPFYWHPPAETYYEVFVEGIKSFVTQNQLPTKCANNVTVNNKIVNCARKWSVKTQSFTSAAVYFGHEAQINVSIRTRRGYLGQKPFFEPKVVSRFGRGHPSTAGVGLGEFNFSVTEPGHYSVELFGQSDLRDALLIFIDDFSTDHGCLKPQGNGTLYHYTGPGVHNPQNPSWLDTGYYAFNETLILRTGDVVCVDRGAYVQAHFGSQGCDSKHVRIAGAGIIAGQGDFRIPHDDNRPLVRLCGSDMRAEGVVFINALASNLELNPYWADGYKDDDPPQGALANNVKVRS